jgi:Icc-related predicted phosphoesterase
MKLLLVAGLHRDAAKVLWLLEEAPKADVLVLGGDLLQIFSNIPAHEQISGVRRTLDVLAEQFPFVVCSSGNHDFFEGEGSRMSSASPAWMHKIEVPNLIGDGQTRQVGDGTDGKTGMIVSTIPWPVTSRELEIEGRKMSYHDFVKGLLRQGRQLRHETGLPWLLVAHEPPGGTPLAANYQAIEAEFTRQMLESVDPDFSYHGHLHEILEVAGGSWHHTVGISTCFNAGQTEPRRHPNCILLEIGGTTEWTATLFKEGIPSEKIKGQRSKNYRSLMI